MNGLTPLVTACWFDHWWLVRGTKKEIETVTVATVLLSDDEWLDLTPPSFRDHIANLCEDMLVRRLRNEEKGHELCPIDVDSASIRASSQFIRQVPDEWLARTGW